MSFSKHQLKPEIKLNIATYQIVGEMNSVNVDDLINRIDNHLHILRGLHVSGLLFSFSRVTKIDKNAFYQLIESFSAFHVKLRAMTGFCNYSEKLYAILRKLILSSPLGLYKTVDIMALAIGTSNLHTQTPILVYAENIDERQLIASTLISNDYFVVMAISKNDLLKKASDKNRFDRIVDNSYFSNIHDDVTISYKNNLFIYEFQGTLDETLAKRINLDDFKYRLSLGYYVIVFDFTCIYHMNLRAAYFLMELEVICESYSALICGIGLSDNKIDANAFGVLDKSSIWLFDDLNHVYEDVEVIEKSSARLPQYSNGISKKLLELTPHFSKASMQTLNIYEVIDPKKSALKQVKIKYLFALKPDIVINIVFSGDYEGEFFFLFTKESAKILIKQILGEVDDYNINDYLDTMSEFVNALTGKLKANLRKKNRCIQFDLPDSSTKLSDFISPRLPQTFIITTFQCNEKNYYVALTSPIEGY